MAPAGSRHPIPAAAVPGVHAARPEKSISLEPGMTINKLVGFIGATVGSYAGWFLGARVGMMTAFMLSVVGTGLGIFLGRRIVRDMLG
jgi:uncharacterized membrane protein YeaQ/YmgE (transglycosylase-associated protein family)